MLIKATNTSKLSLGKLRDVYASSILENAKNKYPHLSEAEQLLQSEQDFYAYFREFFKFPLASYFVLLEEDEYISALRLEQYKDGYLLTALETKPNYRNRGYAKSLVRQVVEQLPEDTVVYSHIEKRNKASVAVHRLCGFRKALDYAALLDGTVSRDYCTMLYKK